MKKAVNLLVISGALGMAVACSDVAFESIPSSACVNANNTKDQSCTLGPNGNEFSVTFKTGQVDILFVNDNSGSMYVEQTKMGGAFPNFLNNISHLDYRIAMTTTDIPATDGRLLQFRDTGGNYSGEYVLTNQTANRNSKFLGTIKRSETLTCEQNNYAAASCPSDDERGIYAANQAITRNEYGFMRDGAHLAVVFLSDEDERSATTYNSSANKWVGVYAQYGYGLEAKDYPVNLVKAFAEKYSTKSMSVHSTIIKPGDTACFNKNVMELGPLNTIRGWYGYQYNILSKALNHGLNAYGNILQGSVSSICDSNLGYRTRLGVIGSLTASYARSAMIKLNCLPPVDEITVTSSPAVNWSLNSSTQNIEFSNLPLGVDVTVKYPCPN